MSLFDDDYKKKRAKRKKEIQERVDKIEKARAEVPKDKTESLVEKIKIFYYEQMQKPINQRQFYKEKGEFGRYIIYFETDDQILYKQNGKPFNIPTITKTGQLRCTVPFPLMTNEDDIFDKRLTLFASPEDFEWDPNRPDRPLKANIGFIARGRLTKDYLPQDSSYSGYALSLPKFLAYIKKQDDYKDIKDLTLEDIDEDDYTIQYTFNQEQLLGAYEL